MDSIPPRPDLRSAPNNAASGSGYMRWMLNVYIVALVVLLVVPYATGAISYAFNVSAAITVRPMYYMLLVGGGLAVSAILSPPRIKLGILLLASLLGWRFLDAGLFDRVTTASSDPAQLSGSSLFFVGCIWLASGYRRYLFQGVLISSVLVTVIVAGLSIYEWRNPGQFSAVAGRSAGFIGNPNDAATVIVLMLALLGSMRLPQVWLLPLAVFGAAGIYFTLSRGGMLLFAVFAGVYLFFTLQSRRWMVLVTVGFTVVLALGAIAWLDFDPFVTDRDIMRRVAAFRGQGIEDIDDTGRFTLLQEGTKAFSEHPFTGYGTGASSETFRPHNMMLGVAIDNGLFALLGFMGAMLLLLHDAWRGRRHQMIVLLPMMLTIMFSHNLLDNTAYLLCWVACIVGLDGSADGPVRVRSEAPRPSGMDRRPLPSGRNGPDGNNRMVNDR